MATIPSNELLIWAGADVNLPNLAGPNKVKPISDLILKGWDFKQKPAADEFNYILNNYAQWIEYLTSYVDEIVINGATGDAASAGVVNYFARASAPVGYLKANGAAINATTYANLATALYVGDSLNATALFGYKCTDALNPSTTRSISGEYIVLPDLRGEFIRGWDDSRGIDSGREFGTSQGDSFKSHYHYYRYIGFDNSNNVNGTTGGGLRYAAGDDLGVGGYNWDSTTGGTETRPRNISLLACIKY